MLIIEVVNGKIEEMYDQTDDDPTPMPLNLGVDYDVVYYSTEGDDEPRIQSTEEFNKSLAHLKNIADDVKFGNESPDDLHFTCDRCKGELEQPVVCASKKLVFCSKCEQLAEDGEVCHRCKKDLDGTEIHHPGLNQVFCSECKRDLDASVEEWNKEDEERVD